MKIVEQKIKGLYLIQSKRNEDLRGYFSHLYSIKDINRILKKSVKFVQQGESLSKKNVFRGLHYQLKPYNQELLVRVLKGEILDISVDIRKNSSTFGKYFEILLSEKNNTQLFISKGFAHGFISLTNDTKVLYQMTNYYSLKHKSGLQLDPNMIKFKKDFFKRNKMIINVDDKNWPDINNIKHY